MVRSGLEGNSGGAATVIEPAPSNQQVRTLRPDWKVSVHMQRSFWNDFSRTNPCRGYPYSVYDGIWRPPGGET